MEPGGTQLEHRDLIEAEARSRTVRTALVVIAAFLVGGGIWVTTSPSGFFRVLGAGEQVQPLAWVAAPAAAALYVTYTLWAVPEVRPVAREVSRFRLLALPLAVLSGLIEEMFFRGWMMDLLQAQGLGVVGQLVISALVFGLVHTVWVAFGVGWRAVVPIVCSTIGLGLLMGSVYLLGGRAVLPAALAHALINLVIEPGLLLHAERRRLAARQPGRDHDGVTPGEG